MSTDPELPGGEVKNTDRPRVEVTDTAVDPLPGGAVEQGAYVAIEPLPGGDVENGSDRLTLRSQTRPLLIQELVRAGLAFSLVLLTALVLVLAFTKVGSGSWANTKEFLDVVIPALIALLGSAMGFYFGSRN